MSRYVCVVLDEDKDMGVFGTWRRFDEAAAWVEKVQAAKVATTVEIRRIEPRTLHAVRRLGRLFRERR